MSSPAASSPPPSPGGGDGRPRMPWERTAEIPLPVRRDGPAGPGEPPGPNRQFFQELKSRVHRRLIERLNLSSLDKLSREQVVDAIRKVVYDLLAQESAPLNFEEREELVRQVLDEIFGLGPIEPLMQDPEISDILVNTYKQVYIERYG